MKTTMMMAAIVLFQIVSTNINAQMNITDIELKTIEGESFTLADYSGKTLILVNTASKCGLTPQLGDLQEIQEKYGDQGLQIIGFPSNDFLGQEPLEGMEIVEFCQTNYGVTFPLTEKIHVKGKKAHPLYKELTSITGDKVSWNFQKFIVDKNGNVVKSISPKTRLIDKDVMAEIEGML